MPFGPFLITSAGLQSKDFMLSSAVLLTSDISSDLHAFLASKKYSQVIVMTDENTKQYCYSRVSSVLPVHTVVTVKSGEEQKNLETCSVIWQKMTDKGLDRHAVMIVLGGGVLGDMGGFCAATYKRGIDFILVPTTLLAQADASIGGKLGIDFNHLKNHIGVFQQPALTILDSNFLKTLPVEELRSGFAEVIKHALITEDGMWDEIRSKSLAEQKWDKLVRHSAEFKSGVVAEDPKEKNIRKLLNAGHTLGHALESYLLSTERRVLHGEAVAAGLISEAYISMKRNLLEEHSFHQLKDYILKIFGTVTFREDEISEIAALTLQDKKNKDNKILCVLFEKIGRARWDCEISLDEAKEALSFYRSLQT
jgi:3-dehydroquinate synthase